MSTVLQLNILKDQLQRKALKIWKDSGHAGLLAIATGVGKTRIAMLAIDEEIKELSFANILVVTPTEKLRDENWKEDFEKFDNLENYKKLTRLCYNSINKLEGEIFDLVVMDEAHHITPENFKFFQNNTIKKVLSLTATEPKDQDKKQLLKQISPTIFRYSLEEAIRDGLVSPFKIKVYFCELDNFRKNVKAGSKLKPFYQTEQRQYDYLCGAIDKLKEDNKIAKEKFQEQFEEASKEQQDLLIKKEEKRKVSFQNSYKMKVLERARFIYNLKTKTKLAKKIIENEFFLKRILIFAGSIEQAEELCEQSFHSKTNDEFFQKFKRKEINRLSCVKSLNEGQNIEELDEILAVQVNSNELNIIQQIGRAIRLREGHEAIVHIICCLNTKDEDWVLSSLESINKDRIEFIENYGE